MKSLLTLALALPSVLGSPAPFPQADSAAHPQDHRIPTSYESAVLGRRILALSKLADFSTTFPTSSSSSPYEDEVTSLGRPDGLAGVPINMMDYIAECEDSGNPTVLAINIATTFRNAAAGSNVSVSLRWTPPYPPPPPAHRISLSLWDRLSETIFGPGEGSAPPDTTPYSAANLPRMSLIGYFEPIEPATVPALGLSACFLAKHPDAKYWLPGNAIHRSSWARLVVTQVYWVGGFGDRAYIGWIPIEEWQSVTREEWSSITLPGEKKGWREWSAVEGSVELDL